jgi:hypothetical protein
MVGRIAMGEIEDSKDAALLPGKRGPCKKQFAA